jgi:hypothetical protein
MNRSIGSSVLLVGGVALMALAGCSRNEPPKQPTSSPTFESDVGTSPPSAPGQPTAPEQPEAAPPGTPSGSPESPQGTTPREGPSPGQPGDSGAGRPPTGHDAAGEHRGPGSSPQGATAPGTEVTPMPTERELCDTLTRDARLLVEDVQGGVTLVLKPRPGRDLSMLREQARQIERRTEHNAGSSIGPSCVIFAIGRGGATTAIAESPDAVRILITTSDPSQVQSIRRQIREFVNKSGNQGSRGQGNSPQPGSGSGGGQ